MLEQCSCKGYISFVIECYKKIETRFNKFYHILNDAYILLSNCTCSTQIFTLKMFFVLFVCLFVCLCFFFCLFFFFFFVFVFFLSFFKNSKSYMQQKVSCKNSKVDAVNLIFFSSKEAYSCG